MPWPRRPTASGKRSPWLTETQERHFCVPVLQWAATFCATHGLADDALRVRGGAVAASATATGQAEAVAALAHVLGETLLAEDPAGRRGRAAPGGRDVRRA